MLRRNLNKLTVGGRERNNSAQSDYDNSPDRAIATLRTDATEVLGQEAGIFTGFYRRKADSILDKIKVAESNTSTVSARETFINFRHNHTQIKIDRIKAKVVNSSDSFLSRQINRQRRQKIDALTVKSKILSKKTNKIEARRQNKPEELQKKVDALIKKKVDALYRKARRIELRRNGIKQHNFIKQADFLASITPDMRNKINREAILQARKINIENGILEPGYEVNETLNTRKIDDYERTIE